MFCFFFFKQKTAYEMRISDWSSDVCSSDLRAAGGHDGHIQIEDDERVANRVDNALRDPPVQLTLAPRALPVGDIVKNQKQKGGFVLRSVDLARIQNKAAMSDSLEILFDFERLDRFLFRDHRFE